MGRVGLMAGTDIVMLVVVVILTFTAALLALA
jgi:hypothetical protein